MKERSKSVMLLLEITIMLLVFAVCAGVCLTLFASSRRMSREAEEQTEAAMWAQSAAEVYKAAGGDLQKAAEALSAKAAGDRLELWLDESWNPGGDDYLLTVTGSGDTATVAVTKDGNTLFSLLVKAVTYG